MRGRVFVGLSLVAASAAAPSFAHANVARSETDGDRFGALIARDDARGEAILAVDSEQLRFDIAEGLARAHVTATYHFRNAAAHAHITSACFVYVAGDTPSADPPSITIDGSPVDYRTARDVDEFRSRLGASPSSRIAGLLFAIPAEAGASRTVVVTYTHVAGEERAKHAAPTYRFDYLLTPAKSWKSFGPLTIDVVLPNHHAWARSSIPWRATSNGYRIELAGLPDEELSFELMPNEKLWFGMTGHAGYWLILLAATALIAFVVSRIAARARHRIVRSLLAGGATFAACLAVVAVHAALSPPYALGFGYDPLLGVFAVILGATAAAMILAGRRGER
jgi:hypothetical protein